MIRQIDHYNIRTGKIDETVKFYSEVLGLRDGPFPGDRKFGAWLYDTTERPVLHLIAVDPANRREAYERVSKEVDAKPFTPLTVKGKTQPLNVFEVLSLK